jgi:hypothetical protein
MFHAHLIRNSAMLVIAGIVLASARDVRADQPSVTAVLDSSETAVGQPVQLQIKITGSRTATMPDNIGVEGLEIRYSGQSQLVESRNFQFSYSVVYNYTVMPTKAGTFRIPPQTVRAGNTSLRTPELTLNVIDTTGGAAPSSRGNEKLDPSKNGFIELIVAKTTAYVGEMIPAEVRLGFNTRTPAESLGNGIDLTGQGFTTQKMRDPRQTIETIRGRSYQVFTFKTAISPVRAGRVDVGPIEANPIVRVPQLNRSRPNMRDPFGMTDPFFDSFFNDPSFAPSAPREIKLKSETAALEVKPLPPKPPPNFSGAVGTFSMTADAKPTAGQVGDPVTVTASITGRGNFDRVSAPVLEDERGWHKYPPSAQFKQDDDVGISGTKTFETVVSANERKDKIPPLTFAFFDPVKEQYVTLRSEAIPARIEGGAATSPTVSANAPAHSATPAATGATPAPKPQDILYQLNELPTARESFAPVFRRKPFWFAQAIPLLMLAGYVGWKLRRARLSNREARRLAQLEHEATELQRKLRRDDLPPREYFAGASRAIQLKTAIAKNVPPHTVDADGAATTFRVDDPTREQLRALFARSDELRYSGGANGSSQLSPETRREVLDLLDQLRT